jgi:hypothetical protein
MCTHSPGYRLVCKGDKEELQVQAGRRLTLWRHPVLQAECTARMYSHSLEDTLSRKVGKLRALLQGVGRPQMLRVPLLQQECKLRIGSHNLGDMLSCKVGMKRALQQGG